MGKDSCSDDHKGYDKGYGGHDDGFFGGKGGVSAGVAFIIWLVVLIIIIWILRAIGIRWFSAIVFGLIVAAIILCLVFPLRFRDGRYIFKQEDGIFALIILITWILLVIWIIWKVFTDREARQNGDCNGSSWWGSGDSTMGDYVKTTHTKSAVVPGPF